MVDAILRNYEDKCDAYTSFFERIDMVSVVLIASSLEEAVVEDNIVFNGLIIIKT